ncbi:MAG: hypothetical protein HQ500_12660 [Flavobacteriales bacterium]|nr:hypothetical protein [Flavobacteriales bacterium]
MTKEEVFQHIEALDTYVQSEGFKGYDPYDILNSKFDLLRLGKMPSAILTQIQKRNPLNLRPLLGIEKEHNPKAMGLFLKAYSKLYQITGEQRYKETADGLFQWLKDNPAKGFSGLSWGYNFGWANPGKVVPRHSPNLVVTGFIAKGLFEYQRIEPTAEIVSMTKQIITFIEDNLQTTEDESGLCYSYTTLERDKCYNASLQAGEIFAWYYAQTKDVAFKEKAIRIAHFVASRQETDGSWNYSESLDGKATRRQLDFHQGYVIESLDFIQDQLGEELLFADHIAKGTSFYRAKLMKENGQTIYRYPIEFPVDIHNQSQAIISCVQCGDYAHAAKTLEWTIRNMRAPQGHFYYNKYPLVSIKTPYIRWAQAWMMLAMSEMCENKIKVTS